MSLTETPVVIPDDDIDDLLSYKQTVNDVDKDKWVKVMDLWDGVYVLQFSVRVYRSTWRESIVLLPLSPHRSFGYNRFCQDYVFPPPWNRYYVVIISVYRCSSVEFCFWCSNQTHWDWCLFHSGSSAPWSTLDVRYIPSLDQLPDCLTKPFTHSQFQT